MAWIHGILIFTVLGLSASFPAGEVDSTEHGVTAGSRKTNCTCGWANKDTKRIVGGREAGIYEYPMIAGIVYKETQILFCGATIVTRRHIVTAAHCAIAFVEKPHQIGIHVGHHNYYKIRKQAILRDVERVILHKKYQAKTVKYDIAVLLLKDALPFDQKVGPACLLPSRVPMVGNKVRVIGWGLTSNKGTQSNVLLKVDVDIKPFEDCMYTNLYLEIFDKHQMCSFTKNKDSCSGDSGGPLMWLDPETNRYTLVGAVSYGSNCGSNPAVNTEVGYFLPWIQQVIAETDSSMKTCSKV
uniref:Venom s1 protease 27 n=1 Tax=Pristhesancus plagipennis TaxID=1955184 RepID=A0A1Q1NPI2_PRIPG|nr:venom s1 protease 27 [Pristhesancus plagipennis]